MKKIKSIPKFKNEVEEKKFWENHDTTDYFDTKNPVKLNLSNLKRSSRSVTVRLPDSLIYSLKMLANKKDIPYQSLLKVYLTEKVREEAFIY
jgi:predicted DNA binding CopG/RHH family protein